MKLLPIITSLLLACTRPQPEPAMSTSPVPAPPSLTYLALGDSYTIGESVSEYERWPVQLADRLRDDKIAVAAPDIIARTGWTTAELQEAIQQSGNQKTYDLVSLLIGVNNQYRGQSQDRYRTEFRTLLQTAIRFAGKRADRVFVLSIPDWGVSPFAAGRDKASIARDIDAFNAIAQDECRRANVVYVDITPLTRQAADNRTAFAYDGLHYSGQQMKLWTDKALPVAKALLAR